MTDFTGGPGNDPFNGGGGDDVAHGAGGDDTLNGFGGTDSLYGEAGDDTIDGGDETDYIIGGAGKDSLSGGGGDDHFLVHDAAELVAGEQIAGGAGSDFLELQFSSGPVDLSSVSITSVEGLQTLGSGYYGELRMTAAQLAGFTSYLDTFMITLTTAGSVTLSQVGGRHGVFYLAAAGNTLDMRNDGGDAGVRVYGADGADIVWGTGAYGNDLQGNGGNDQLYGGAARDWLYGGDGDDKLDGGAEEDRLFGDGGNDVLNGGLGYDHLAGGEGRDTLQGGGGDDELIVNSPFEIVAGETYGGGDGSDTLTIAGGGSFDFSAVTLSGVERLDNPYGTVILSVAQLAGFTHLSGMVQISTAGAVTLSGSYGDVRLLLNPAGNQVDASGATGGVWLAGGEADDAIVGGASADRLEGGGGIDPIDGGGGDDRIVGGAGADKLQGGAGNDVIVFESAFDHAAGETIDGGVGFDLIRWSDLSSSFTLDLSSATLTGIEGVDTGPHGGTVMLTAAQLNALGAVHGNLTLTTGGTVTMAGVVSAAPSGIPSNLIFTLAADGNVFDMTGFAAAFANVFGQGGADTVVGSAGEDNVYGGAGNDSISGKDGADRIVGGAGADSLSGGGGDDLFVIEAASEVEAGESSSGGTGFDVLRIGGADPVNLSAIGLADIDGIDATFGKAQLTAAQLNGLAGASGGFVLTTAGSVSMNGVVSVGVGGGGRFELADGTNHFDLTGYGPGAGQVVGGSGSDTVIGYTGFDRLGGGGGNDVLDGRGGDDRMEGGTGDDTFYVNHVSDVVIEASDEGVDRVFASVSFSLAGQFADNLTLTGSAAIDGNGNALDNILTGNAAVNLLDGGAGADTMTGGGGNDTYRVDDTADKVVEAAAGGTDLVLSSVSHALAAEVENVTLTGAAAANATGNGLANILNGNAAANVLDGGAGADTMTGGAGGDIYVVDNSGDAVIEAAGGGVDTVRSSLAITLQAEVENLTLTGSLGIAGTGNALANTITGNAAGNLIDGGAGADTMAGEGGDDTYIVDNAGDKAVEAAGGGTDTVQSSVGYTLVAELENLTLTGTAAIAGTGNGLNNFIVGNAAANALNGGAGDDSLNGGAGADSMAGGLGNDTYFVDAAGDQVGEAAGQGIDLVRSAVSYTLGAEVENLMLGGPAAVNGTGNGLGNVLTGNSLANALSGGAGDDVLDGGTGSDTLNGGAGNDRFVVDGVGDVLQETAAGGTDTVHSSISFSLAGLYVENLVLTGASALNGTGNGMANLLTGNAGANVLNGGAGADTMTGGGGNDRYVVDNAADKAIETSASGGTDLVESAVTFSLAGQYLDNLTLTGTAAANATGNGLANILVGNSAANVLNGGGGADTMTGGAGNDRYVVDNAADKAVETSASGGTDLVESAVSFSLAGGYVDNLTLTGAAAVNATGNGLANTLAGNNAANQLRGGGGNDILSGNGGADGFYFETAAGAGNVDRILDFNVVDDTIFIDNAVFAGLAAGALASGAFRSGAAAADADDRIIYNSATGALLFDSDGAGGAAAAQFATLATGLATLSASDFTVI
jgi:Ca2+-binding RTX toxin-like protein